MNIFTDELIYQYIITGTFVFVINTFLLCSCMSQLKDELQPDELQPDELQPEELQPEELQSEELQPEEELQEDEEQEDEEQEDKEQEDEEQEDEDQENQEDENQEDEEEKEETNILKTGEENSHVYKGFNLMTKKQLIRFVGREHTYKNKNELIIIAINKFILISIDRVDSIPVFVKKYIKNA